MMLRKYLFIKKISLLFILVCFSSIVMSAEEALASKAVDSGQEITISCAHGEQRGLHKVALLPCKDAKDNIFTREAQVILVPDTGFVWVGLPNSRCFLLNSSIIGVTPLGSPEGGNLLVRVSTNKIVNFNTINTMRKQLDDYLNSLTGESIVPAITDKRIVLSQYFGRSALINLDRSDGAKPVQIISLTIQDKQIVISMKSSLEKKLVLTLDEQLNPLKGVVDDQITFELGRINPPSLVDELRSHIGKEPKKGK